MKNWQLIKQKHRTNRKYRVRKKMHGTELKPRLSVNKTNKHIFAQIIDDEKSVTLAVISTYSKDFRNTEFAKKNKTSAKKLGEKIGELATKKNIKELVFDRGFSKYHGIVAEFADGVRSQGIKI